MLLAMMARAAATKTRASPFQLRRAKISAEPIFPARQQGAFNAMRKVRMKSFLNTHMFVVLITHYHAITMTHVRFKSTNHLFTLRA